MLTNYDRRSSANRNNYNPPPSYILVTFQRPVRNVSSDHFSVRLHVMSFATLYRHEIPVTATLDQQATELMLGTHYPCSGAVFTGRKHGPWTRTYGPWTRVVCTELKHWYLELCAVRAVSLSVTNRQVVPGPYRGSLQSSADPLAGGEGNIPSQHPIPLGPSGLAT